MTGMWVGSVVGWDIAAGRLRPYGRPARARTLHEAPHSEDDRPDPLTQVAAVSVAAAAAAAVAAHATVEKSREAAASCRPRSILLVGVCRGVAVEAAMVGWLLARACW